MQGAEGLLTPGCRAAPASIASASGSFSSAAIQVDIASVSGDQGHACSMAPALGTAQKRPADNSWAFQCRGMLFSSQRLPCIRNHQQGRMTEARAHLDQQACDLNRRQCVLQQRHHLRTRAGELPSVPAISGIESRSSPQAGGANTADRPKVDRRTDSWGLAVRPSAHPVHLQHVLLPQVGAQALDALVRAQRLDGRGAGEAGLRHRQLHREQAASGRRGAL